MTDNHCHYFALVDSWVLAELVLELDVVHFVELVHEKEVHLNCNKRFVLNFVHREHGVVVFWKLAQQHECSFWELVYFLQCCKLLLFFERQVDCSHHFY